MSLTAACALFLLARFAVLPLLTIRHIVVQSDVPLSEDQVLALSGIQGTAHWHSLAADGSRSGWRPIPLVRRARVEKVFPDTLRLTVWGRQPAALVLADADGRTLPVLVDEEGSCSRWAPRARSSTCPWSRGCPWGHGAGRAAPARLRALFADLRARCARTRPRSPRLISEVQGRVRRLGRHRPAGFDLLVYLTSSPVPVRAPGTIDESLLKYALMVLDLLSDQGVLKNIQELDFRSGEVVYRMKEG